MGSWVLVRLLSSLWAGLESIYSVGGILCCTYCEVEVTFAFLCLPEGALGHLESRFSLIMCLLMTRTAFPMLKAPFSSELSEL